MAMVLTHDKTLEQVGGSMRTTMGTLAMDDSYSANGEALTARQVGLWRVAQLHVYPSQGYLFEWDQAASKVKVLYADYDAVSDGPKEPQPAIVQPRGEQVGRRLIWCEVCNKYHVDNRSDLAEMAHLPRHLRRAVKKALRTW